MELTSCLSSNCDSLPGCFSFVCDCKHDQQQKHIESIIQNINRGHLNKKPRPLVEASNSELNNLQEGKIPVTESTRRQSKARKATPRNRSHIHRSVSPSHPSSSLDSIRHPAQTYPTPRRKRSHHLEEVDSDSDLSEECHRNGDETFIQAEGTIVPPDIQQYANRKITSRSETEQLNYLSEISQKLNECLKKINKYDTRGQELLQQIHQTTSSPSSPSTHQHQHTISDQLIDCGKAARRLRRRYQKYLVNSHRKYIDVGNLIARKFENKISSSLKRQFLFVENEFNELSQVVERRGIEVRKKIESIEIQIQNLQEISFADEESDLEDEVSVPDVIHSNEIAPIRRGHSGGGGGGGSSRRNRNRDRSGRNGGHVRGDDDSSVSGMSGDDVPVAQESHHRSRRIFSLLVGDDEQEFIASEDDLLMTTTATTRRTSQSTKQLHKRQKSSEQQNYAPPGGGTWNEIVLPSPSQENSSSRSSSLHHHRPSFDSQKLIETFDNLPFLGDLLYTSDPTSSPQLQLQNRIHATSLLDSLLESIREEGHEQGEGYEQGEGEGEELMESYSQIISTFLIPKFFFDLCSFFTNHLPSPPPPSEGNSSSPNAHDEFLLKLFVIEVIWQQYAIRNENISHKILEFSDQLEHLLFRKISFTNQINLFAFFRRKALWIRLMTHVHTPPLGAGGGDGNGSESLRMIAAGAEEKLWSMIISFLLHSGTDLIISLLQCLPSHSTSLHSLPPPLLPPLVSDLLITLATLTSSTFRDSSQLASTAYLSMEEANKSQIKINNLWSIVNFHLIQSLGNLQTENSILTSLSFYERSKTPKSILSAGESSPVDAIPAFLGSNLNSSSLSHHFHRIDSSLWATILLFTLIQSKQNQSPSSSSLSSSSSTIDGSRQTSLIGFASLPSNWPLVKELTKDLTEFSRLTDWLLRICDLLPLWDNSSNGYDLFRELLSRLVTLECPWCLPCLTISAIDLTSLQTEIFLITEAYQSHLVDIHSLTPLFTIPVDTTNTSTDTASTTNTTSFVSPILLNLFAHLCSSLGMTPPRYHLPPHHEPLTEFGEDILPFALALFTKGLDKIPKHSISFKRIQNRLSTLPLLCKETTSTLSAPICLISLVKYSVNIFGSSFYTASIHQTLLNRISNEKIYCEEERCFLSWYLSLILFLPAQSQVSEAAAVAAAGTTRTSTTILPRLGFSYLFNKFQNVLEQILSGEKSSYHSLSQVVTLISLLPIIDGIHSSEYRSAPTATPTAGGGGVTDDDLNENKIRLIFSLWNGTMRTMSLLTGNTSSTMPMDEIVLQLCFCGLQRLFSNLTTYLRSHSLVEINRSPSPSCLLP